MSADNVEARITTEVCLRRGCVQLKVREFHGRRVRTCGVTGKIPGNMPACPMDSGQAVII